MRVLAYSHDSFRHHDTGVGHPERPSRLTAVLDGLAASEAEIGHRQAPEAPLEALLEVHDPAYIRALNSFCMQGGGALDPDTRAGADSWEAALRAAGAGLAAVTQLRHGAADAAFLAVRPPGHHARSASAMGFCLFNNVAITAASLLRHGEKVAILDFDVHHGNGTQDAFYTEADVLYVSFHEFPAYPGSGWVDESGRGPGRGTTINLPFPAGTAGDVYRAALERIVVPVTRQFGPDWLLVSAGYDAHAADPLASLRLQASDYGFIMGAMASLVPRGRVLYFLEGGYDLDAMEASVAATINGVGELPGELREESPRSAWRAVDLAAEEAAHNWEVG